MTEKIQKKEQQRSSEIPGTKQNADYFYLFLFILLGIGIRIAFIPFESNDYKYILLKWYNGLASGDVLNSLKTTISDYPPLYLYLIWLSTFLPLTPLAAIKLISIGFDLLGSFYVSRLVGLKFHNPLISRIAFIIVFFAPTVIVNSSVWGQCDMIYTSCLAAALYYLLKNRNIPALIWYGTAFAFKLQTVFLAPLLFVMLIKKRIKVREILLIPAAYLVSIVPSLIAGRPLKDLLLIYLKQAGEYPKLTLGFANFYQWITKGDFEMFRNAGIIMAAASFTFICFLFHKSRQNVDNEFILKLSLLSLLVIPFLLPCMHERYYFPVDVLSIALAFHLPRYFYIAVTMSLVSFFSYCDNMFGAYIIGPKYLAIAVFIVIITFSYDIVKYLYPAASIRKPSLQK